MTRATRSGAVTFRRECGRTQRCPRCSSCWPCSVWRSPEKRGSSGCFCTAGSAGCACVDCRRHFDASHASKTPTAVGMGTRSANPLPHQRFAPIQKLWHRDRAWRSGGGLCWGATRQGISRSKRRSDARCGPVLILQRSHRSRIVFFPVLSPKVVQAVGVLLTASSLFISSDRNPLNNVAGHAPLPPVVESRRPRISVPRQVLHVFQWHSLFQQVGDRASKRSASIHRTWGDNSR